MNSHDLKSYAEARIVAMNLSEDGPLGSEAVVALAEPDGASIRLSDGQALDEICRNLNEIDDALSLMVGWLSEKSEYVTTGTMATMYMSPEQARRWNDGETTDADADDILVSMPTTSRGLPTSWIGSLNECERFYPDWYSQQIEGRGVSPRPR